MSEVFISYARQDEPSARRVIGALQAAGFTVWWDGELPAHRAYSEVIESRLREAEAVVALWSKHSSQSQWVRAEADFARSAGKLVQAQLDGTMPPIPFNQIQCADLKGWRGNRKHAGWAKLEASVGALLSGEEPLIVPASPCARWWQTLQARWALAAGVLLLVLAAIFVPRFIGGSGEKPVVAVLPFKSLDQRDESLVAGIWEDTRQALSRNPQLLVLGPNTSEQLADNEGTAKRAADFLVEASVRSAGDRIRVSANLVRTDDGAQLWSESFERRLDDVFKLQQQIAGEIEGRIRGRLAERGGTLPQHIATSGEVYALYSEARSNIRNRRVHRYYEAQKQLQEVVQRDPNFAPGWATLAVSKALFGTSNQPREDAVSDARRAIALAPNLAAGHAALGLALGRQGPAAKATLQRAVALDPNDIEAMNWLSNVLQMEGNEKEAAKYQDRILELEPLWWPAILNKISRLTKAADSAGAEEQIARLEKIGDQMTLTLVKMHMAERKGDLSTAVGLGLERYRAAAPQEREMIGQLMFGPLAQLEMFEILDRVTPPPSPWVPFIRRNDPKAIEIFEKEFEPRQFWTFGYLNIVGARVYMLNGEARRLARRYHEAAKTPDEFMALIGKESISQVSPNVALALRRNGEEAEARTLLQLALDNVDESDGTPEDLQVSLARIHAVQGRKDEAIGELSSAVRRGWIPPYLPIHVDLGLDPALGELKSDPRFEPLRQQILGHLRKERAELGPIPLSSLN